VDALTGAPVSETGGLLSSLRPPEPVYGDEFRSGFLPIDIAAHQVGTAMDKVESATGKAIESVVHEVSGATQKFIDETIKSWNSSDNKIRQTLTNEWDESITQVRNLFDRFSSNPKVKEAIAQLGEKAGEKLYDLQRGLVSLQNKAERWVDRIHGQSEVVSEQEGLATEASLEDENLKMTQNQLNVSDTAQTLDDPYKQAASYALLSVRHTPIQSLNSSLPEEMIVKFLPAINKMASSHLGSGYREVGLEAEKAALEMLFEKGYRILLYEQIRGGRGFDGLTISPEGKLSVMESKVDWGNTKSNFNSTLGRGYGYKQTSPEWIKEVASRSIPFNNDPEVRQALNQLVDDPSSAKSIGVKTGFSLEKSVVKSVVEIHENTPGMKWKLVESLPVATELVEGIGSSGSLKSLKSFGQGVVKGLDKVALPLALVIDGSRLFDAYQQDGNGFGKNFQTTAGGVAGGLAGAWAGASGGAAMGGAIGVWFGGAGAVPGAAIGGLIGGVAGGFAGSGAGEWVGSGEAGKWTASTGQWISSGEAGKWATSTVDGLNHAVSATTQNAVEQVSHGANQAMHEVSTTFQNTTEGIASAANQVNQNISTAFRDATEKGTDAVDYAKQSASSVIQETTQDVSDIANQVIQGASTAIQDAKEEISNVVHQASQDISALTQEATDKVSDAINHVGQAIPETIQNTSEMISDATNQVIQEASTASQNIAEGISRTVDQVGQDISAVLQDTTDEALSAVSYADQVVSEVIQDTSEIVSESARQVVQEVSTIARSSTDGISGAVESVSQDVSTVFQDATQNVSDTVSQASQDLVETAQDTAKAASEIVNQASQEMSENYEKASQWIGSFFK
jgi:vacuolar-type H+-ATPase subunit H